MSIQLRKVVVQPIRPTSKPISLDVPSGEYAVMVGPTGIGKTTILETICGLRKIASGEVFLRHQDVNGMSSRERRIAYVPQDGVLFPTETVWGNLVFGMNRSRSLSEAQFAKVHELAHRLSITSLLPRLAQHLSGGEVQRIALGRALLTQPDILLLDEPLNALDPQMVRQVLSILLELKASRSCTVLHVTHSEREVRELADQIIDRFEIHQASQIGSQKID